MAPRCHFQPHIPNSAPQSPRKCSISPPPFLTHLLLAQPPLKGLQSSLEIRGRFGFQPRRAPPGPPAPPLPPQPHGGTPGKPRRPYAGSDMAALAYLAISHNPHTGSDAIFAWPKWRPPCASLDPTTHLVISHNSSLPPGSDAILRDQNGVFRVPLYIPQNTSLYPTIPLSSPEATPFSVTKMAPSVCLSISLSTPWNIPQFPLPSRK